MKKSRQPSSVPPLPLPDRPDLSSVVEAEATLPLPADRPDLSRPISPNVVSLDDEFLQCFDEWMSSSQTSLTQRKVRENSHVAILSILQCQ